MLRLLGIRQICEFVKFFNLARHFFTLYLDIRRKPATCRNETKPYKMKKSKKDNPVDTTTSDETATPSPVLADFGCRNVIVKFRSSLNTGNIRDKKLTAESIQEHGVTGKRLSVRKYIMQGAELNEVINLIQSARNYLNSKSLPWLDEGIRIVPATHILDLTGEMKDRIRKILVAREKLLLKYEEIIERDKKELNGTFDIADYPSPDSLREKFNADIEIRPVATDFRVTGIDAAVQRTIQDQVASSIETAVKEAKHYQLEQVHQLLTHLHDKLSVKDKGFKVTSIENVINACDDIRNLALVDDPEMFKLAESVASVFKNVNADNLRENETERKEVADASFAKLKEIEEAMKGFV